MNEFTEDRAAPTPAPKPISLRNSHWCTDRAGRLGMIGDASSSPVQFHYETGEGLGAAVAVNIDELTIAKFADLPERLGYTRSQAAEMGYL